MFKQIETAHCNLRKLLHETKTSDQINEIISPAEIISNLLLLTKDLILKIF